MPAILIVTAMFPRRQQPTLGIVVQRECQELSRAGLDLTVVAKAPGLWSYVALLCNIIRALLRRPDVVHAHYGTAAFLAAPLSRLCRIPCVVTLHGSDIMYRREGPLKYRLQALLTVFGCLASHAVVVQAEFMREILPRRLRSRTVVLPQAVAEDFWKVARFQPAQEIIVFLGDKRRWVKNWPLAKEAVDRLLESGWPWESGDDGRQFVSLDECPANEIPALLASAKAGILTSTSEGLPVAMREAIVAGLPIVAVPLAGTTELRDNFPETVEIAQASAVDLADALSRAAPRDERLQALRARADGLGWHPASHSVRLLGLYELAMSTRKKVGRDGPP